MSRPLLLGAALALLALSAAPAHAVDVQSEAAVQSNKSLSDYLGDLEGSSDPDRLYAARVLRGELRRALRTEAKAAPGSLAQLDARALLVELSDRLPRACTTGLRYKNSVGPCADMLAMLEATEALPALREALKGETRRGPRKSIENAIAALEAKAPASAPTAPAPAPTAPAPASVPAPAPPAASTEAPAPAAPPTPADPPVAPAR